MAGTGLRPDGRRLDSGEHHRGAGLGLRVLHRPPRRVGRPCGVVDRSIDRRRRQCAVGSESVSSVGADWCGWSHPRLRRGQHCDRVRQRCEGRFRHLAADATLRVRGDCFGLDPVRVRAGERCGRRRPRREPDRAPVVAARRERDRRRSQRRRHGDPRVSVVGSAGADRTSDPPGDDRQRPAGRLDRDWHRDDRRFWCDVPGDGSDGVSAGVGLAVGCRVAVVRAVHRRGGRR